MQVFSAEQAAEMIGAENFAAFLGGVEWAPIEGAGVRKIPADSGDKVRLARALNFPLSGIGPTWVWIDEWGIWPTCEHMVLFDGYRRGHGEERALGEAPFHLFGPEEGDELISVLSLTLFFVWGAHIVSADRSVRIRISHDGWIDAAVAADQTALAPRVVEVLPPASD